jgi:hypothetical protein
MKTILVKTGNAKVNKIVEAFNNVFKTDYVYKNNKIFETTGADKKINILLNKIREETPAKIIHENTMPLSYLIEGELEKAEAVLAAKNIIDSLQGLAEDINKIQTDNVLPLVDALKQNFDLNTATEFSENAKKHLSALYENVLNAKDELGTMVANMEAVLNGEEPQTINSTKDIELDSEDFKELDNMESEDDQEPDDTRRMKKESFVKKNTRLIKEAKVFRDISTKEVCFLEKAYGDYYAIRSGRDGINFSIMLKSSNIDDIEHLILFEEEKESKLYIYDRENKTQWKFEFINDCLVISSISGTIKLSKNDARDMFLGRESINESQTIEKFGDVWTSNDGWKTFKTKRGWCINTNSPKNPSCYSDDKRVVLYFKSENEAQDYIKSRLV